MEASYCCGVSLAFCSTTRERRSEDGKFLVTHPSIFTFYRLLPTLSFRSLTCIVQQVSQLFCTQNVNARISRRSSNMRSQKDRVHIHLSDIRYIYTFVQRSNRFALISSCGSKCILSPCAKSLYKDGYTTAQLLP
jgi:hypothetical protein